MNISPLTHSVLAALLLSTQVSAQVDGISREEMWFAPTEEDWAKPCLVTWERSWDDALTVARETGKPILICVNMDGEIASEHYAGIRYRQPDIAALYEPYATPFPTGGFDLDAVQTVDFLDTGWRGYVDFGQIIADHVDPNEDQAALL